MIFRLEIFKSDYSSYRHVFRKNTIPLLLLSGCNKPGDLRQNYRTKVAVLILEPKRPSPPVPGTPRFIKF